MCEAGRIRHHLKNHLWQPSTTVMLAGFQAEGSLGRLLETGERTVRIMGEDIEVRARIVKFEDYSGHADAPELLQWLKERLPIAKGVFLTHGEEDAQVALEQSIAGLIAAQERIRRPSLDDVYDLSGDRFIALTEESRPRISPDNIASLDSHNALTKLLLDIQDRLRKEAGEKNREKVIRRLRRALEED
jgi:metallo-beta-lactamase family protein